MIYGFAGVGIELPHYAGYQYTSGPQAPLLQIKRGDMIFYGPNASQHVALYLGDGKMVEAPQSGSIVKVSPLRTDGAMPMVVRWSGCSDPTVPGHPVGQSSWRVFSRRD